MNLKEAESKRGFISDIYQQNSENHRELMRYHLEQLDKLKKGF